MKKGTLILSLGALIIGLTAGRIYSSYKTASLAQYSIKDLMYNRRLVGDFDKTRPVPEEDLKKIVNAGLYAPSQNYRYPYRLTVLTRSKRGQRKLEKIVESWFSYTEHCDEWGSKMTQLPGAVLSAPINIFVSTEKDRDPLAKGYQGEWELSNRAIDRDAMLAIGAMILQAEQLGYKTRFTGVFDNPLALPERFHGGSDPDNIKTRYPLGILSLGYPVSKIKLLGFSLFQKGEMNIDLHCQGLPKPISRFAPIKYDKADNAITQVGPKTGPAVLPPRKLVKYF